MQDGKFENVATAILALFPPFAEGEQRVALTLYRLLAEGGAVSSELWVAKHPGTLLATLDQAWQLGQRHNAQRYPMLRR